MKPAWAGVGICLRPTLSGLPCQTALVPSTRVARGLLQALNGGGARSFQRGLQANHLDLFPTGSDGIPVRMPGGCAPRPRAVRMLKLGSIVHMIESPAPQPGSGRSPETQRRAGTTG